MKSLCLQKQIFLFIHVYFFGASDKQMLGCFDKMFSFFVCFFNCALSGISINQVHFKNGVYLFLQRNTQVPLGFSEEYFGTRQNLVI